MSAVKVKQRSSHGLLELIGYYETFNKAKCKSPKTVDWYTANLKPSS
ncbi:MAG: hypothetical protein HYX87_04415 [Chloroflexi bacterium]|nr:hypothetical protein [Chloroflexota bacterium]